MTKKPMYKPLRQLRHLTEHHQPNGAAQYLRELADIIEQNPGTVWIEMIGLRVECETEEGPISVFSQPTPVFFDSPTGDGE